MEINIRNKKKWNQDGFYVGRPSPLSNPFKIEGDQTREIVIQRYGAMLKNCIQKRDPITIDALHKIEHHLIKHKIANLICYCAPEQCHADLIKQVLLNKIHTNYWLVADKCKECGHITHKIGIYDI